ncbi:Ig-like domain-containing protein [Lysinibacillus sp. NPDC093692]|uniref:Ig-like domain-containing protein n=1 Tax=Lysinibacillus sp. NPDC093692 TaxID=3390578 RepID=UPI003CFDC149
MSKLLKNGFIYLVLTLLVLVSISVESASAAEVVDYEEGVTNLNNTPENSAVIGDSLLTPELGWKRYDGNNPKITIGNLTDYSVPTFEKFYKGTTAFFGNNNTASFIISGTKFRIFGAIYHNRSSSVEVSIDGNVVDTYSYNTQLNHATVYQRLVYEKNNLSSGTHLIVIKNLDITKPFEIDAIDVDGQLLSSGEVPDVQSITLDKNNLELLEGSQDKLTATVTPDSAKVIWSSSDESIATVDQDGNVTAVREGEASITAKIEGTDITATSTVIVKKPSNESSNAILSITLVNGITKEYDVTNKVLNDYLKWFDSAQGTSTFKFTKTISPYKKVTEYIVHDKIASFEVREY